jgi:hypothetical protein
VWYLKATVCAVLTAMLTRSLVLFEIFTFTLPIAVSEGTLNNDIVTTTSGRKVLVQILCPTHPPTTISMVNTLYE